MSVVGEFVACGRLWVIKNGPKAKRKTWYSSLTFVF